MAIVKSRGKSVIKGVTLAFRRISDERNGLFAEIEAAFTVSISHYLPSLSVPFPDPAERYPSLGDRI